MTAYLGSAADLKWVTSSGTTTLTGDYRTFAYTPSIEFLDETAGADTAVMRIPYMKDGAATYGALLQAGTMAGGTLMTAACVEGQLGSLIWCPEGTAVTKPKYTIPAYSQGAVLNWAYNTLTEVSISWQQNGARVEGTN
jgi:hypothetical protein